MEYHENNQTLNCFKGMCFTLMEEFSETKAVLSAYECPFCSKTNKRAKSLQNHIKDNHKQEKLKEETTEDAVCK